MDYEILEWDTAVLGELVARISVPRLEVSALDQTLSDLRSAGTRLVYWASAEKLATASIAQAGGILVDEKTTFLAELRRLAAELAGEDAAIACHQTGAVDDLVNLAVQSGAYSRFAVDPRIPREKFVDLYTRWMHACLQKEQASEVLVLNEGSRVLGMVTVGEKKGRGDIGLIAVDGQHRGQGLGVRLVRAAQRWSLEQGYSLTQVVTQGRNTAACRLYAKCGYRVERVEYFYHFWL